MRPNTTTKRLLALFLIAVVVSGGVYTVGTLRDSEGGSVTVATGSSGPTTGNSATNAVGVCAAGNDLCTTDLGEGGQPSEDQERVDQQPTHSLLQASVAQDRTRAP